MNQPSALWLVAFFAVWAIVIVAFVIAAWKREDTLPPHPRNTIGHALDTHRPQSSEDLPEYGWDTHTTNEGAR